MSYIELSQQGNFERVLDSNQPVYEIEPQTWKGNSIIEVIRDGGPWSARGDSHFRFGRKKTRMIVSCMDYIRDFCLSPNPGNLVPAPIFNEDDPDMSIQIQTFPDFKNAKGKYIERPFLRLERVGDGKSSCRIGIGREKAVALFELRKVLNDWLNGSYR